MTIRATDNNPSPSPTPESSQWERRQGARRTIVRRRFGVSFGQVVSAVLGTAIWIMGAILIFGPSDESTKTATATTATEHAAHQGRAVATFSPSEKSTATAETAKPVVREEQKAERAALPTSGAVGRVGKDGAFACPTPETFKKFLSIGQNDAAMAFRWAVVNGCDMIHRGSKVVVEDTNWWGLACVSRIDRPGCLG